MGVFDLHKSLSVSGSSIFLQRYLFPISVQGYRNSQIILPLCRAEDFVCRTSRKRLELWPLFCSSILRIKGASEEQAFGRIPAKIPFMVKARREQRSVGLKPGIISSSTSGGDASLMGPRQADTMIASPVPGLLMGADPSEGSRSGTVKKTRTRSPRRSTAQQSHCDWCGKTIRSRKSVRHVLHPPECELKSPVGQIILAGSNLCQPTCYLAWMNFSGQLKYALLTITLFENYCAADMK